MVGRDFDHTTYAQAFSMPGIDPRVWVSMAIVDIPGEDSGDSQTVEFDEDDGQLYVNVTLKPMDTPLRARVGMLAAGSGEAVYFPFCGGEEVLVAIPEGNMRSGAVVICRMNNAYDGFPFDSVGGADPKQNAAAMLRTRTALTIESGASVLIRSAAAGAMLALSGDGTITLRDAKANVLQMSPDVFGFQTGEGDTVMQLALTDKRYTLQIGQAAITLTGNASSAVPQSMIQVPASMTLASGGLSMNTAVEHVATTESIMNVLGQLTVLLATPAVAPLPTATAGALAAVLAAQLPLAITAASLAPQLPTIGAALVQAFANPAMASAKLPPSAVALGYQQFPGIGCTGFLAGLGLEHGQPARRFPAPARCPERIGARPRSGRPELSTFAYRGGYLRIQASIVQFLTIDQHSVSELQAPFAVQFLARPQMQPERPSRRGGQLRRGAQADRGRGHGGREYRLLTGTAALRQNRP